MIAPGPGILLIAEPFLKDPNFMRTVVLLCEHHNEGSFGFVINRKYEFRLNELMNNMEDLDLPIYYGGPVRKDSLHFLHQYPDLIPEGQPIDKDIYWGGDFEEAIRLLREGRIHPERIRFYIGYSGWSQGQLQEELTQQSWLTVKANRKIVFEPEEDNIWKESLRLLGGDYEQLVNYPIDPQLN